MDLGEIHPALVMLYVVCKMFQFIMLTWLSLHETYMFVNKLGNLPAYTNPKYLERGDYYIQAYISSIQHQNLTPIGLLLIHLTCNYRYRWGESTMNLIHPTGK